MSSQARTFRLPQATNGHDRDEVLRQLDEAAVQAVYRRLGVDRFRSGGENDWSTFVPWRENTHTEALSVQRATGIWHDHATGEGGSIFDAVMRTEGCDFPDALAIVASITGAGSVPTTTHKPTRHARGATTSERKRIVATYPYEDEAGALVFEVVRFDPKGFSQRRPAGPHDPPSKQREGWVWNLDGVLRVPYRLPQLIASGERVVFIAEGEKDVDRLIDLGLIATTNPQGAGKWLPEYADHFGHRHVVILPDNDDPGLDHGHTIAASLHGIAASVKVVELPLGPRLPKKGRDVSDWLDAGGSVDELKRLAREAPAWEPAEADARPARQDRYSAAELLKTEFPEPRWSIPGLQPEGLMLLVGRPKIGKSWFSLGSSVAVASGGKALGTFPVNAGPVLYLALEDGPRRVKSRLQAILNGSPAPEALDIWTRCRPIDEGGLDDIEAWLRTHPGARQVTIDTFKRIRPKAQRNQTLYDSDYEAVAPLQTLAQTYNVTIMLVHHARKAEADDPLDLISGSTGIPAAADGAMILKRDRGQADAVLHVVHRDLESDRELALRWEPTICGWASIGSAEEARLSQPRRDVLEVLTLHGAQYPRDLAQFLGISGEATRKRLHDMARDGQVKYWPDGRYTAIQPLTHTSNGGNSSNSGNGSNGGNGQEAAPTVTTVTSADEGSNASLAEKANTGAAIATTVTTVTGVTTPGKEPRCQHCRAVIHPSNKSGYCAHPDCLRERQGLPS